MSRSAAARANRRGEPPPSPEPLPSPALDSHTHLDIVLGERPAGNEHGEWAPGEDVDAEIAAAALTEGACPLTARELDVLRHALGGGTVAVIARQAHLAAGTVRNYLSSAMTKLGVSTRYEAARLAWDEGWI